MIDDNKKINILIVNKYFDAVGGMEETVRQLADIVLSDISVTVLACTTPRQVQKIKQYSHSARVIIAPTIIRLFQLPISLSFFRSFLKEYRKADIVHIHTPFPSGELALYIARYFIKPKPRIIFTYHSDIVKQGILRSFYVPFLQRVYKMADFIVVTSPAMLTHSVIAPFSERLIVIPSAVRKYAFDDNHVYSSFSYFLFVGRFIYYKGLSYLLEAFKTLPYRLIIAGDGPLLHDIELYIKNNPSSLLNVEVNVTEERKKDLLHGAGAFVFPSCEISEAFGLSQIEAMAQGVPVINTNLATGVPWVARNKQEALTVTPKNVSELREAMKILASTPLLRERLGKAGFVRARDLFNEDSLRSSYVTVYRNMIKDKK